MKKVLIICGSPRPGGNSDLLADQFAKGATESGNTVEIIHLRNLKINYCLGCLGCLPDKMACVQRDDANSLIPKLVAADVIVFSTPVYYYSVTAQMKTFLDRMNPLFGHLSNKELYYMVTAVDEDHTQLDRAMDALQGWADCFDNMKVCGRVYGGGAGNKGDIVKLPSYQQAYDMGKKL
ncbi:MAG: flavodoxin family protein [Bacteroidales bacterium]|nr:flavodoxin family protein [Bacteroidales bacterium]